MLPFLNLSESPDNDYFSDGLTEEILHLLTRVRELRVATGPATFALKGTKESAAQVGARLGVGVVLEGSVRRDRDRLRVTAKLVDGRTGFQLWSQVYDRRLAEVFAIQEDIARQVVGALELVLSGPSRRELDRPQPASLEAYDLYLRGRAALRLPAKVETLEQATRLFEQAIAADGQFAVAFAGLCDAWLARYELTRAAVAYERAEQACQVALDREPQAAAVYQALGNLHITSGDAARAEGELTRAAGLATNPALALTGLARAQEALGGPPRRRPPTRRRGRRTRPTGGCRRSSAASSSGGALRGSGRAYAQVVARTPDSPKAHGNLGAARYLAGDFEGAAAPSGPRSSCGPTHSALSNLGSAAFYLGRYEEAASMFRRAAGLTPDDHVLWGNLGDALTYAAGRGAEAADAYRRAVGLAERELAINREDDDTRRHAGPLPGTAREGRTGPTASRRGAAALRDQSVRPVQRRAGEPAARRLRRVARGAGAGGGARVPAAAPGARCRPGLAARAASLRGAGDGRGGCTRVA